MHPLPLLHPLYHGFLGLDSSSSASSASISSLLGLVDLEAAGERGAAEAAEHAHPAAGGLLPGGLQVLVPLVAVVAGHAEDPEGDQGAGHAAADDRPGVLV